MIEIEELGNIRSKSAITDNISIVLPATLPIITRLITQAQSPPVRYPFTRKLDAVFNLTIS